MAVLVALLDRAGDVVTRSDLQHVLWGADLFVEFDKGLNVAVTKVRAALSDLPEKPRYIETVPGQGYRFAADVERVFGTSTASASAKSLRDAQQPAPSSTRLTDDHPFQPDPVRQGFVSAGIRPPWLQRRGGTSVIAVTVCLVLLAVTVTKLTSRRSQAEDRVHDENGFTWKDGAFTQFDFPGAAATGIFALPANHQPDRKRACRGLRFGRQCAP